MTDSAAFQSFIETHPELWEAVGQAWEMQRHTDSWRIRYRTMREVVCVVGKFDERFFDAECEKAFG